VGAAHETLGSETALLDLLPDGVVLADASGRVVAANPVASDLLETPVAPGDALSDVVHLQDLEGNDWLRCTAPFDGLPTRTRLTETTWWSPAGRELLVTASIGRARPAGEVTGVAICLRLASARQRGDRHRSELVATVAHELRSPLTGVKGFTSTLISKWDRLTDSQKLLMLRTVDADADRLTRLITELLDVARIDAGRISVRKIPLDVEATVAELLSPMVAPTGRVVRFEPAGAAVVWADRDRLAQILANLVENAFVHGSGDVVVRVVPRADGGVDLVVDDSGAGIPEDIRSRIFTKFWRRGPGSGTGLGLFIVSGLVQAHGGEVLVEQAPTGGARLRVVLPQGEPAGLD
jgi:signal transduction histidine kinase